MEMEMSSSSCCVPKLLCPSLTLDLITEILLRLPPKPLARFKCVSKSWNSLISGRQFILRHIAFNHSLSSATATHLAFLSFSSLDTMDLCSLDSSLSLTPPKSKTLPFTTRARDADLFGSVHGLLGISDYPNFLSLFNPTNSTFRVLPVEPLQPVVESHWVVFSLGYDSLSDDYKIVRLDQVNEPQPTPVEARVYSMKLGNWRKIESKFPHFLAYPKENGKFLQASDATSTCTSSLLLWVAAVNPPAIYNTRTIMGARGQLHKWDNVYLLAEFNLSTEEFHVTELPGFDYSDGTYGGKREGHESPRPSLVVSGGSNLLAQVEFGPSPKNRVVEVWLRKDYGGVEKKMINKDNIPWVKLFRFAYMEAQPQGCVRGRVKPVLMSEDGAEVLMEEMSHYFWFNVRSGEIREVKIPGHLPEQFQWVGGFPHQLRASVYVDSLVALDNSGLEHAVKDHPEDNRYGIIMQTPGGGYEKMSMAEFRRRTQQ